MTRTERVNTVAAAVADGRITASRRAFWLNRLRMTPASIDELNKLVPALAPAVPDWFC